MDRNRKNISSIAEVWSILRMPDEPLHDQKFPLPDSLIGRIVVTNLDRISNWGRKNSVWPMMFGLACCAIEMICTQASRFDMSRFGMEITRPSPRQSDLLIVSGTVTKKMIPTIVRLYNQMTEPKYVIAMGACASGGGPFREGYNVVPGIDRVLPVDIYIPGCPPTPQALLNGLMELQKVISSQSIRTAAWYRKTDREVPVPVLGSDLEFTSRENGSRSSEDRGA
jgi:NADH-quinone oxidoreductase subunit B